jgi:O-antigen/teichoic acid export membrane protein
MNLVLFVRKFWSACFGLKALGHHLSILVISNAIFNGSGFLISVLSARFISPEAFGLIASLITLTQLLAVALDLGLNIASVRYYNYYTALGHQESAFSVLGANLKIKLILSGLLFAASFILASSISQALFKSSTHSLQVQLALWCAGCVLLYENLRSFLQSLSQFNQYSWLTGIVGAARLLIFGISALIVGISADMVLLSTYLFPLTGGILLWLTLFSQRRPLVKAFEKALDWKLLRRTLAFGKWILISTMCLALGQRVIILQLTSLTSQEQVGLFSAALNLASIVSLFQFSIRLYLLPKVSSLTTFVAVQRYLKLAGTLAIASFFLIPLGLALGPQIFHWIYGSAYAAGQVMFIILLMTFILALSTSLVVLLVYTYNVPQLDAATNVIRLACILIFGPWVISAHQALGAAWLYSGVFLGGELLMIAVLTTCYLLRGRSPAGHGY